MSISVVIPALDEEGNIGRLIEETHAAIPEAQLGEVIVVDDGSTDRTGTVVKNRLSEFPTLRYIRHTFRAGQSAALRTGVVAARFPVIATMDGDGQNDPNDIARLFGRLGPVGVEPAMVAGIRVDRKGKGSRRFASRFANWIRDTVLADGCPDTGCGLKVYQRDAFLEIPYFTSMHRYLPAFFMTYGHEMILEPVNDRVRLSGTSKYSNLGRALIGLYDLFGVAWLRKRTLVPRRAEDISGATDLARQEAAAARSTSVLN